LSISFWPIRAGDSSMLALPAGMMLPSNLAEADTILPLMALAGPVDGLGAGGFMVLGGSVMTVIGANVPPLPRWAATAAAVAPAWAGRSSSAPCRH
jgi:hypothetical protein